MADSELQQLSKTDRNPVQETRYQELLRQSNIPHTIENGKASIAGFGTGGNLATTEQFDAATGGVMDSSSGSTGLGTFVQPTINLPQIYQNLYDASGIKSSESDLTAKTQDFNNRVAAVKDNPYLSEATMTGRIGKLSDKFSADKANAQNDIAMKKADIETQLNLQTKQFDINSQQATQAREQFNSLLAAGALDNASGEDIANLVRATGIPSSMIQSAISVSKASKVKAQKANTQTIQYDDGNNTGFAVINADTGQIISKQVIAASKPTAAEEKAALGTSTKATSTKAPTATQLKADAAKAAQAGKTYQDLLKFFSAQGLSALQIYKIYTAANYYGRPPDNVDPKTGLYKKK